MGTSLTFHGQDGDVVLDDRTITFVPGSDDAGEPVVLPRSEISGVELKGATLLGYGSFAVSTRGGERHSVQFARGEQERFTNLEAILNP